MVEVGGGVESAGDADGRRGIGGAWGLLYVQGHHVTW